GRRKVRAEEQFRQRVSARPGAEGEERLDGDVTLLVPRGGERQERVDAGLAEPLQGADVAVLEERVAGVVGHEVVHERGGRAVAADAPEGQRPGPADGRLAVPERLLERLGDAVV